MTREAVEKKVDQQDILIALHMDDHANLDERLEQLDLDIPVEDDVVYSKDKPDLSKIPPDLDGTNKIVHPNMFRKVRRTISERERDLADEQRLYLQGYTLREIGEWIGENRDYKIGLGQISKDINLVEDRWRLSYLGDMNDMKVRELKKIDRVEIALWASWDKSLMDIVETENTTVVGINDTDGKDEEEESEKKKKQQKTLYGQGKGFHRTRTYEKRTSTYGDIRIMEQVLKCIELRSKILGLITNKVSVSRDWKKEAESLGFDPQEILDGFKERIIDSAVASGRVGGSDQGEQASYTELPDSGSTQAISE